MELFLRKKKLLLQKILGSSNCLGQKNLGKKIGQKHFGAEKIKVKNILVIKISGKNFFGSNKFLHEKKVWVLQFFCQKNSGMGKKYLGQLPKKGRGYSQINSCTSNHNN